MGVFLTLNWNLQTADSSILSGVLIFNNIHNWSELNSNREYGSFVLHLRFRQRLRS